MEFLKLQIPPFVRIDLFQVILTQALSIGNFLDFVITILYTLVYNAVTGTYVLYMWADAVILAMDIDFILFFV